MKFQLTSNFKPSGDQPQAIEQLTKNVESRSKYQVLLGVTGSGKSVTGSSQVLVKDNNGAIKAEKIGELIDHLFEKFSEKIEVIHDSEILNTYSLPKEYQLKTYSFNPSTKQSSWQVIKEFSRHLSPENLYKLTSSDGKEITVTGDHNFFVLRNGKILLVPTTNISDTDYIPCPLSLPNPENDLQILTLDTYLSGHKLYLTLPKFTEIYKTYKENIDKQITYQKRYHMLNQQERIGISSFEQIASISSLREGATLASSHKGRYIPLDLPITPSLMRLFGYYIAEGHAEENYFIISSNDQEIISDFTTTLLILGNPVKRRIDTYDYVVNSKVFTLVLKEFAGSHSYNKKLPSFWMQLSKDNLAELLKAYFSADGGVDGAAITATTASKQLASDITYALLRFGIHTHIRKKQVKLPHWDEKHTYWVIAISGQQDIQTFEKEISFCLKKKREKLATVSNLRYNTNTDLIPIDGKILKSLRQNLLLFQKDIAKSLSIERSYISMLESNLRKPSRDIFRNLIEFFIKQVQKRNNPELLEKLHEYQNLLHLYWVKVKKIEIAETETYVYDFAVENNETFLAGNGGLFVHNTYTMANVIQNIQKPTLIVSHNKTLAGQLYQEFRDFFPENAVSYFVSYYDYYQPEAYIPQSDTYIEKEAEINDEIDKLRLSATTNLLTRKDVIVVASVSCIYNLGSPIEYGKFILELRTGMKIQQRDVMVRLTDLQYERNEYGFHRSTFRIRGEAVDLFPAYMDNGIRMEIQNGVLKKLLEFDPLTGDTTKVLDATVIYPAKHYMTDPTSYSDVFPQIKKDMEEQVEKLKARGKLLEAQRLMQRTNFDLEMIREVGYVNGIENYSRYFDGRKPGAPPFTLLDYMKACSDDWLLFVDESHMTMPQIRGMYNGDRARKETLIDYGFRLPSALDNRPLKFEEFMTRVNQAVFVSATPDEYELSLAAETKNGVAEQLIRPTGIVDPQITIKPTQGQIADLIEEINKRIAKGQRILVTTLTKKMSEELSYYLEERGIKVLYLHSDIETLERQDVLDKLRRGDVDVIVGINLLREGLDLPEVTLVAILDADKEGFLRSRTSLIQTMGRAARNIESEVILYADVRTKSIDAAVKEVERRREIQLAYNKKHDITPETIQKAIRARLVEEEQEVEMNHKPIDLLLELGQKEVLLADEKEQLIKKLRQEMKNAAKNLDFETAALLRDRVRALEQ